MKAIKRIFAIVMCLILTLSCMIFTASAAEAQKGGSITIQNSSSSSATVANKTFNLFRIFSASAEGNNISYEWAADENGNTFEAFFKQGTYNWLSASGATIYDVVEEIAKLPSHSYELSAFAAAVHDWVHVSGMGDSAVYQVDPVETITASSTATSVVFDGDTDGLDLGYYMIFDATDLTNEKSAVRSAAMLDTNDKDIVITLKADRPHVEKYVNDNAAYTNGEVGATASWLLGSTASIGDIKDFKIVSAVPDHNLYGDSYTFIISDKLPEALSLVDGSVKVYIGGTDVTSNTEKIEFLTADNTADLKISFKTIPSETTGSEIRVEYKAKVGETTILTHKNTAILTYSNDPSNNTTASSEAVATVYTYHNVIVKRAESATGTPSVQRLGGAQFKIYAVGSTSPLAFRKVQYTDAAGKTFEAYVYTGSTIDDITAADDITDTLDTYNDKTGDDGSAVLTSSSGGHLGEIAVIGLGEGSYEIEEITAPAGYRKAESKFSVTITDTIGDLGSVSGISTSTSTPQDKGGQILATSDYATLHVWLGITNRPGSVLPETGGMGTTLFTVAGIVLMAGALAFFTSRKRNSAV